MATRFCRFPVLLALALGVATAACSQKAKKHSLRAGATDALRANGQAAASADSRAPAGSPGGAMIAAGAPPGCQALKTFYDELWQPIFADKCITCHRADGFASYSNLKLTPAVKWSELAADVKIIAAVALRQTPDGVSYLVAKPTRQVNHDGGLVFDKADPRAAKLAAFAKAPPSLAGCDSATGAVAADPLALLKDVSQTRLLRRASLAIRGVLPELSDYADLEAGRHTYAELLDGYLNEDSSDKFSRRLEKHHLRRFIKNLVGEAKVFNPKPLGEGLAFRLKGWVGGPAHFYTPHPSACMTVPQSGMRQIDEYAFKNWDTAQTTAAENCALEAPMKALALLSRKMLLSPSHPLKLSWMTNWYDSPRTPLKAVDFGLINHPADYDAAGNVILPVVYGPHPYYLNWFAGTYMDWGVYTGAAVYNSGIRNIYSYAMWIPSPGNDGNAEEYAEMWRPGWFTGCLLPNESPVTDAQWAQMQAGTLSPRLDTAGLPMQPNAYAAVKVATWWGADAYACPGLAIPEALKAGVITRAPSYYRRNAANNNASEYLPANRLPTQVDGVNTADFFSARYKTYRTQPDKSVVPTGALDYQYYGMLDPNQFLQKSGEWAQATAFGEDTLQNPLVDCGDHMRYCNPYWSLGSVASTYEGQALYRGIIKGKRPYRDFLSGKTRATNRSLEFAWFHRQQEGTSIMNAALPVAMPGDDNSQVMNVAGTWPHGDLLSALAGLPALPNAAWETLPQSPALYSTNKGTPEPPEEILNTFRLTERPTGAPVVGVLTSSSFLNNYIVNRTRANKLNQFFQCKAFPPASGSFQIDPSEVGKSPRLMVKSGCAGCHESGGVDRYANHFMEWTGDLLNTNFRITDTYKSPYWFMPYVPADKIVASHPTGYYGIAPDGTVDSWAGQPVTKGVERLAEILGEEPGFTTCTVESLWQMMLARVPSTDERGVVDGIVETFKGKPYTLQDIAKAIAQSEAFRKSP